MRLAGAFCMALMLHGSAMDQPPRLAQSAGRTIIVDREHDDLVGQPGVVKIRDSLNSCKIAKEAKVAGIGNNSVKIASFDGLQENILLPPSNIEVDKWEGCYGPCSLGITRQLATVISQKDKGTAWKQKKIGILDIETGAYLQCLDDASVWIRRMFYDANNSRLIVVYPESIQLWDLKSGEITQTIARQTDGHFKHKVIFSKPKSRIINIGKGAVEWCDTRSGTFTMLVDSFDTELADVFTMQKNEMAVVSSAFVQTRGNDPKRNPFPVIDDEGRRTFFKSITPTIRFYHLKEGWAPETIVSDDEQSIHDLAYLKKTHQLVAAEDHKLKLYDIKTHRQTVIAQGESFFRAQCCNKSDSLMIQCSSDLYILDLNKFKLSTQH